MNCTDITTGLTAVVCGVKELGGTGAKVYLINTDDLDRSLTVVTNNVVTDLVLKATKKAALLTTLEDSTLGEVAIEKGTYFSNWAHTLSLRLFTKNELSKAFVNTLTGARVIAIVENKATGTAGNVKYEIYGFDSGLEVSEVTSTTDLTDGVTYEMKLMSSEKAKENSLPKSYFDTDLATTESALASLIA